MRNETLTTASADWASSVDLARNAVLETVDSPHEVGRHQGALSESEGLASHYFTCHKKGYKGWQWVVTVAQVSAQDPVTVCEINLMPGTSALLAPDWIPWADRLLPSDLTPADVLPYKAEDENLEPGFEATGDPEIDEVAAGELALARARVLSPEGKEKTARRWMANLNTTLSNETHPPCSSCGYIIPLQGSLGQVFGVCVSDWSNFDGRVVPLAMGCGVHSESDVPGQPTAWPDAAPFINESQIELVVRD